MKKQTLISSLLIAASLAFLTGCTVYEQAPPPQPQSVVVEDSPPPPQVEVVPVAPGPLDVWYWVPGAYVWRGHWVWAEGRWAARPHRGAVWVAGGWAYHGHHREWIEGHWR